MIHLRFYLHSKVSEKGTQSLYIDVRCDGINRLRQATGEVLRPNQWNPKREQVTTRHEYSDHLNARIERIKGQVQQTFREMLDAGTLPTGEDLRKILRPLREQKKQAKSHTAVEYLQEWIDAYTTRRGYGGQVNKDSHARKFRQVITHLNRHKPGITPQQMTEKAWHDYMAYLYSEELEDSTVGKHLQGWKNVLKMAGLPFDLPHLKNTFNTEKINHDLTWQEMKMLHEFTFSKPQYREAIDAFLIACQLGLRRGDLESVKKLHLVTYETSFGPTLCIRKRQGKTGQPVVVPFPPLAKSIYDKYEGMPKIQTNYNELLKDAAKEAKLNRLVTVESIRNGVLTEKEEPLHKVISSHKARHTAASRVREASDFETAQLVLGHATAGNTGRYAHLEPVKTAEKILKAWAYYK
ncbi:tyrosine-type recombinase/integrase [Pontibacter sp. BT731]|uniref:tyrosine-type recombinase/integrase n=1 Tax=Pontibacter coccineus TaxID=3063328 RepID=UPI0026E20125|nr:tyrosine-type recombinase/integrase [Pontibacter sp. BT731]MDO6389062.1 tyrosine-type recombinase/integrase [Pontibacter sp. BT731]